VFETEGYLLRSLFVCLRPGLSSYLVQAEDGNHIVIGSRSVAVVGGAGGAPEWESEQEERRSTGVRAAALRIVPAVEPVSEKARRLGYLTVDDLKRAVLMQGATWWQGSAYHCPLCDVNFGDKQRAAAHVVKLQHPVLRMD
jgi:hypothetical protein